MDEELTQDELQAQQAAQNKEMQMKLALANATPDQQAMLAQFYQAKKEDEEQRKEMLRQQLANQLQATSTPIDWTPLAAALKDWTGSEAPLIAAQSNAAGNAQDQARNNALFDQLTKQNKSDSDVFKNLERTKRFEQSQGQKIEKDIRDQKTKIDRDATNIIAGFATVESAFTPDKSGNLDLQKVMSGLSNYARNIGSEKGALNEGDVDRAAYIRDFLTQYETLKLKFGERGVIPQSQMQPYLDRLIEAKESQRARLQTNAQSLYNAYAQAPSSQHLFQGEDSYGNKIFKDTFNTINKAGYVNPALRPKSEQPAPLLKQGSGKKSPPKNEFEGMTPEQAVELPEDKYQEYLKSIKVKK